MSPMWYCSYKSGVGTFFSTAVVIEWPPLCRGGCCLPTSMLDRISPAQGNAVGLSVLDSQADSFKLWSHRVGKQFLCQTTAQYVRVRTVDRHTPNALPMLSPRQDRKRDK